MRRIAVIFCFIFALIDQPALAGCRFYLRAGYSDSQEEAMHKAEQIKSITSMLSPRVLLNDKGYTVYLVDNSKSRHQIEQTQKLLAEHHIPTKLESDCEELTAESMKVSEDMSRWPYIVEPTKTMRAVSPDSLHQTKPKPLNLREAILLGLRFSPDVKNAEIDQIIQKFDMRLNDWQFQWQYSLDGDATWNNTHSFAGDSTSHTYSLNTAANKKFMTGTDVKVGLNNNAHGDTLNPQVQFNMTQPLIKGSSKEIILTDWNNTRDSYLISRMSYRQAMMARINEIVKNYRQLIINNNNLQTVRQALKDSERTLHNNAIQIRLGRMAETVNIPQASQVESNRLSLEQSKNQILQSRQSLLQSIGLDPDTLISVPDDVKLSEKIVPDEQETIEYALQHNIDYQIKLINLRKTKRSLEKARNDLLWELDANASVSLGSTSGDGKDARLSSLTNGRNHNESVGLSLKVPLNRKDLEYGISKQVLALEKEKNSLYKAKRDLITTVKNMLINVRSQVRQLVIAEKALALSKRTYEITLKKQQLGRTSSLDVTQSQNDLIQKRINLIQTKVNYLNVMTELDFLLNKTLDRWQVKLKG